MSKYIERDSFYKTMIKRFGCIPALTDYSESAKNDINLYDALNLIPAADVAPRAGWISVEERLPLVSGRYICAVKDKNGHTWTVAGDYSLEMKKWFGLMFGEIKNTVTHWMPLPEPPDMKGGE